MDGWMERRREEDLVESFYQCDHVTAKRPASPFGFYTFFFAFESLREKKLSFTLFFFFFFSLSPLNWQLFTEIKTLDNKRAVGVM